MRFDETGDNANIRFGQFFIDQSGRAVARHAKLDQCSGTFRFVIDDSIFSRDLRSQHAVQLFARVGPVRSQLVQQRDILWRNMR